jgi:hypothetical protein
VSTSYFPNLGGEIAAIDNWPLKVGPQLDVN